MEPAVNVIFYTTAMEILSIREYAESDLEGTREWAARLAKHHGCAIHIAEITEIDLITPENP